MSTIQVRNVGTYGFDVTPLSGLGLSTSDAATTRTQVSDAQALADAIRQALEAARDAGVQAFKPSDDELTLPAGMTASRRDELFNTVIGRAYAGGPMSLSDWSRAVDDLEHWAGQQASMLPPEAGGGSRTVRGIWYVNGLSWSLSELFTVNRVNTLSEIDRMVADSLNVIAANNDAAKALTSLMKALFDDYYQMDEDDRGTLPMVSQAGQVDALHPIEYEQLKKYAEKYIGTNSMIARLEQITGYSAPAYNKDNFYNDGDIVTANDASGASKFYSVDDTNVLQAKGGVRNSVNGYFPTWLSGRDYYENDVVFHNNKIWQKNGDTYQRAEPPDRWTEVIDYNSLTKYQDKRMGDGTPGQVVWYQGSLYEMIAFSDLAGNNNTLGADPTDTRYWELIGQPAVAPNKEPRDNPALWKEVLGTGGLTKGDFRAMIDEVETIIGAFGADNQVAQLRNETLFNSRSNLLEGLSSFLKGQQTTRSTLARNA